MEHISNSQLRTLVSTAVDKKVEDTDPFTAWDITRQLREENPDTFIKHDKAKAAIRCLFDMGDMDGYVQTGVAVTAALSPSVLYHHEGSDPTMHPAVAEAQAEIQRRQDAEDAENEENEDDELPVYTCFTCGADFCADTLPLTQTDDGPLCPACVGSHTDSTPRGPLGGAAVIIPASVALPSDTPAGTPAWAVTPAPFAFRLEHRKNRHGALAAFPDQPSREAAVEAALAYLTKEHPESCCEVLDGAAYAWDPERGNLVTMDERQRHLKAEAVIAITEI